MPNLSAKFFKIILVIFLSSLLACGGSSDDEGESSACAALKVINGQECKSEMLPVVLLETETDRGSTICTGTIIGNNEVLTAAHCISPGLRRARVLHNNAEQDANEFAVHPLFFSSGEDVQYDLGLLRVSGIASRAGVTPASLKSSNNLNSGETLALIGYGLSENGTSGRNLPGGNPRAANLKVADFNDNLIFTLYDETKTNACFGDSGAPAIKDGSIVGIVVGGTVADCKDGDINVLNSVMSETSRIFIRGLVSDVSYK